jgi:hypothetical protein
MKMATADDRETYCQNHLPEELKLLVCLTRMGLLSHCVAIISLNNVTMWEKYLDLMLMVVLS